MENAAAPLDGALNLTMHLRIKREAESVPGSRAAGLFTGRCLAPRVRPELEDEFLPLLRQLCNVLLDHVGLLEHAGEGIAYLGQVAPDLPARAAHNHLHLPLVAVIPLAKGRDWGSESVPEHDLTRVGVANLDLAVVPSRNHLCHAVPVEVKPQDRRGLVATFYAPRASQVLVYPHRPVGKRVREVPLVKAGQAHDAVALRELMDHLLVTEDPDLEIV